MKRKICILLTTLMVLGCLAPALAAEEDPTSLYEQYGPWNTWTQEQKDAAEETWTEEAWDQYWMDYEAWAWLPMDQYYLDNADWSMVHYDYDAGGEDWYDYLVEEKTAMGMPFPEGINVSLNGVYLDFGGLEPMAVNGRTLVPFRALLEGMGAQVDYQDGLITAKTEAGDTLTMELGSSTLSYTVGDKLMETDMGAAPTAVSGRVYIPVRAAAEALGLGVYWDDYYEAAYLTDWDALQAEVDSYFTCYNELMAASMAAVDWSKTYAGTGNMTLTGTLYGEKEHDSASLALDVATLQSKDGVSADLTLGVDLGDLEDTIFSALPPEALELIHGADGDKISVILNTNEGTVYVQGGGVFQLTGEMGEDQWMGVRMDDAQRVMLSQLLSGGWEFTLGSLLVEQQKNSGWYYESPWETVMDTVLPLRIFLGDENFTRKESGSTVTYSAHLDLLTLKDRLDELGIDYEEVGLADLLTGQVQLPDVKMDLTAKTVDGKLQTMDCTGRINVPGAFPVDVTFDMSATPLKSTCTVEFKGEYVGKITLEADSTSSVTNRTVPAAPPEGAEIQWMN